MFPYADGTVPIGDLNLTQSEIFGATLGELHRSTLNFQTQAQRQPLNLDYLLDGSYQVIANCLQDVPNDLVYLERAIERIKLQLQDIPQQPPFW